MEDLQLDPIRQVRIAKLWAFAGIAWAIAFPLLIYALTLNPSRLEIVFVLIPAAGISFGAVELAARWQARTHRRYAYPHRLGYAVAAIHDFKEACTVTVDSLGEWLDLKAVIIGVLSEDDREVEPVAAYGLEKAWLLNAVPISAASCGLGETGARHPVRRSSEDDPWLHSLPKMDVVTVPLPSREQTLGVLLLAADRRNPQLGDTRLLAALAMVLGLALDNCRLYEGQRANALHYEGLHRMKSDFLNTVSHELRTPLTSITLAAEMLLEEEAPEDATEAKGRLLRNIVKGAARMRSLVEDLVSTSRQDDFLPRLEPETTVLRDVISGAVQIVQPLLSAKAQTLEVAEDDPDLLVRIDRLRFEQVLINLFSNAQRYSPPGGHILVHSGSSGNEVMITVTDSGPGVGPEDADQIFEPFFRGDRSGLGLGLAIAKSIVELHRGRIWVEPAPGYGSRFCVAVPAPQRAAQVISSTRVDYTQKESREGAAPH